jgi:predicted nuclease of predicted toxin-antitoxin system
VPLLEFLANMNISPLTVEKLREHGWNIIRVSEIMDKKSPDLEILAYAREHNKVIITQDLDFSRLLAVGRYSKPSVNNLRLEIANPDRVANRIIDVVTAMEEELKAGLVVSVDETTARYQNLPLRI